MNEPVGTQNGRLMAQHDCYTLASNPHSAGTKSHDNFVAAFNKVRTPTCEHEFTGWRSLAGGLGGERSCKKCGIGAMAWSLEFLP